MIQSSKYQHPIDFSWPNHQRATLRNLLQTIKSVCPDRWSGMVEYIKRHDDDLSDCIEEAKRTIEYAEGRSEREEQSALRMGM